MKPSRVIELQTHSTRPGNVPRTQTVPAFMAIECDTEHRDRFTPQLMQWSDRVWIMDLRSCRRFWRDEAARRGVDALNLFRHMLGTAPYRAVTAPHPWKAVLLLRLMARQGMDGMLNGSGSFGAKLYRELPWSVWFESLETLHAHFEQTGGKPYHKSDFKRDRDLMLRAVKRLGFKTLSGLGRIDAGSIKRRFGPCMAAVWRWTTGSEQRGFPWRSWKELTPPAVERNLDYACREWEQVENWLNEDLERLCQQDSWSERERVVLLVWRMVLEDLDCDLVVPIRFRNPHCLHLERPHHKTALLQAQYAYQQARSELLQEIGEFEEVDRLPVVAWRLVVAERFTCPERNLALFDWIGSGHRDRDKVRTLENQLPIPLKRYELRHDFLPESSFGEYREYREAPAHQAQWLEAARTRPLFIYQAPKKAEPPQRHQFLERVQVKWWQAAPGPNLNREYYRVWDNRQRCRWMYRDQLGEWYEHGLFS